MIIDSFSATTMYGQLRIRAEESMHAVRELFPTSCQKFEHVSHVVGVLKVYYLLSYAGG